MYAESTTEVDSRTARRPIGLHADAVDGLGGWSVEL